ncbi:MAG: DUF2939 domain-containing protein [Rhodospirillales bacterium]|nr:DUF2939 domain-containing protein [Rhodospirillales bacterium]
MQRVPRTILILTALVIGYWAWPLHAAMQIRDAMIAGDTETLKRRIVWDSVRATLKASISPEAAARLEADPNAPQPTLWQRIKNTVRPTVANTVIDRYVTPENLPVLLGYRRIWRGTVQPALGYPEPPTILADTAFAGTAIDRFASFWKRLRRAVIHSPAKVVVEVEDKYNPGRSYTGTFELRGLEWKLTELTVGGTGF